MTDELKVIVCLGAIGRHHRLASLLHILEDKDINYVLSDEPTPTPIHELMLIDHSRLTDLVAVMPEDELKWYEGSKKKGGKTKYKRS